MIRAILSILFAFLYLILGIPVLGVEYLIGKKYPEKRDYSSLRMVQWAFRVIYKICGIRVTVIGQEKIPADRPVLYACNHSSYFDIIIGYSLCRNRTGYIAKDSIGKVPLLKTWMKRLYCLFMNREDVKQSLQTILTAISYIKKGISICIFPEGTRNKGTSLLPFKEGSFKIAEKTGCPIVPMAITNTAAIAKENGLGVRPTHVIIEYCDPIFTDQLDRSEKKLLGSKTKQIIENSIEKNKLLI